MRYIALFMFFSILSACDQSENAPNAKTGKPSAVKGQPAPDSANSQANPQNPNPSAAPGPVNPVTTPGEGMAPSPSPSQTPSPPANPNPGQNPVPTPGPNPSPMTPAPESAQSEGCTSGKGLPEGEATFNQGDLKRKYVLRLPKNYSKDKAYPLVLALHPNGSNAGYWDGTSGERALRPLLADKAIILMAQARVNDWRGDLPIEQAYFDTVIGKLKKELCIDTKRIFSMGFSGGGSFSGVLGCNRSDIRAIASGGAVIYFDPKNCVGKPAAWITIGDGESAKERLEFRDFWRDRNACKKEGKALTPETCTAYTCPDAEHPVTFCSHAGDHVWPKFGIQSAWDFLAQFK